MKPVKTFVTFRCDINDDVETIENDSIIPSGKYIADIIVTGLRSQGALVGEPAQYRFYGWSFGVRHGKCEYWCLLQCPNHWLLIVKDTVSLFRKIMGWHNQNNLLEIVQNIDTVLNNYKIISNIQWFTKKEYENSCCLDSDTFV